MTPVVPCVSAAPRGSIAPLRRDAVERGEEDEAHQRDLEIEVHQLDAGDLEQPEILLVKVKTMALGEEVDKPRRPDAGDERERERHASELGKDARCRDCEAPEDAALASRDDRVGQEGSEGGAQEGGDSREDG